VPRPVRAWLEQSRQLATGRGLTPTRTERPRLGLTPTRIQRPRRRRRTGAERLFADCSRAAPPGRAFLDVAVADM